jgi:predicted DNA-binding transcriptional regulator YafY
MLHSDSFCVKGLRETIITWGIGLFLGEHLLSLEDAWIKAAVEHKTLEIEYHSARTRGELTVREVEPDFCGVSSNGKNSGLWGICRLRGDLRCFQPDSVVRWRYIGNPFIPNPRGRWRELLAVYSSKGLAQKNF